jgi:RNA polymerase sigma factor (sigma-70 family)
LNKADSNINQLADHLFQHESGKMVAVLVKIFGTENLQVAEDVVQDTILRAMEIWKLKGLPDNPPAWLYRVARNKAIDIVRRNKFSLQYDFNDNERVLLRSEYTLSVAMDNLWREDHIQDDLLRMMYACCHPEISAESQITLILKTLCGFSTAEVARSFLAAEDTISKRLYRTREFFREKKLRPEFPPVQEIERRTEAVLRAIYLIFNEGYNTTNTDTHIRKDLIAQAIYLCNLLCTNHHTRSPEVNAAMALMIFHAARIDSRIGDEGDIILLSHQDRSKWDRKLIEKGSEYLGMAAEGETMSSYHIEAAIAYEHCIASRFEDTNWQRILAYYNWLSAINPSAVVLLNRLTVIYKISGAGAALKEIENTSNRAEWDKNYLYHSLLGEIYSISDKRLAQRCYEQAISLTQSAAERKLLQKKIELLRT